MTISATQLDHLLKAALADQTQEAAFFKALLDATVHAHCPAGDRSGRLRFVQFHGPEGEVLLPFFSDRAKAEAAASPNIRIVSLPGRTFLEATLGASLVLNPNDNWCKLYPAEVQQLLGGGNLVNLEKVDFGGKEFIWRPASRIPDGLVEHLVMSLQLLESLDSAYLVEMAPADHPDRIEVVVALRSPALVKDRLVRTVITDLQLHFPAPEVPLAVVSIDSAEPSPEWVEALELNPLYKRESSA